MVVVVVRWNFNKYYEQHVVWQQFDATIMTFNNNEKCLKIYALSVCCDDSTYDNQLISRQNSYRHDVKVGYVWFIVVNIDNNNNMKKLSTTLTIIGKNNINSFLKFTTTTIIILIIIIKKLSYGDKKKHRKRANIKIDVTLSLVVLLNCCLLLLLVLLSVLLLLLL